VFGSGALQLTVTSKLLSADIDLSLDLLTVGPQGITAPKAEERLRRVVAKVNAALSKDLPYIQVCQSSRWAKADWLGCAEVARLNKAVEIDGYPDRRALKLSLLRFA
jgi:hypothetical protein